MKNYLKVHKKYFKIILGITYQREVKVTHNNQDTWKVNKYNNLQSINTAKGHSLPHGTSERKYEEQHMVMHNVKEGAALQKEGKVRNCHIDDMNGKCEKPRSYFCLAVDAFGENKIRSGKQQAAATHKGTAGDREG